MNEDDLNKPSLDWLSHPRAEPSSASGAELAEAGYRRGYQHGCDYAVELLRNHLTFLGLMKLRKVEDLLEPAIHQWRHQHPITDRSPPPQYKED